MRPIAIVILLSACLLPACRRPSENQARRSATAPLPFPTAPGKRATAEGTADISGLTGETGRAAPESIEVVVSEVASDPELVPARNDEWVRIVSPANEEVVPNPVSFSFDTGERISTVALFVDEMPLQERPFVPGRKSYMHEFKGVNVVRRLTLEGYGENGKLLASDSISFLPSSGYMPLPPGFNGYVIQAINDVWRYPRDGSSPYCWRKCPGTMGMLHDTWYMGQRMWEGTGTCFCTGHTLEILLDAIRRWRAANGVDLRSPFGPLSMDSLRGGEFYQYWQGYGVSNEASSADALEAAGIGYNIYADSWDTAQPGDFVNLSRENGTGHAVIFHSWLREDGRIVGLRYYGCNRRGDADPSPPPSSKGTRHSGPSFVSARFLDEGGHVLPQFLFIGHVVDPLLGY